MELIFKESFLKDIKQIKDQKVKKKLEEIILDFENAQCLSQIKNLKKLKGFENFYRLKIGKFRIGLQIKKDKVWFVRCLHRKEIYKYFP